MPQATPTPGKTLLDPSNHLLIMLELQRDWARGETYNETVEISIAHGGGYGLGLIYAKTMFGGGEGH